MTPQVFALLNSNRSHARALALANRCLTETQTDRQAITACFLLAYGREPSEEETELILEHWVSVESQISDRAVPWPQQPTHVERDAVEENTGERFRFIETLYSNFDFVPDLQPTDVDKHTRAFADVCLAILNSNEFVYVY